MLEVRSLSKYYGRQRAVTDASFSIRRGEIVGYLGPNGAGKTTTLRMIVGLLAPDGGGVLFDGQDVRSNITDFKAKLGFVPENAELYSYLSGFELLRLVGRLRRMPERRLADKAKALLEAFGLAGHVHAPLAEYSKGMRQKVLLAAALLHDPQLLVLDEPLTGLDANAVMVVKEILRRFAERGRLVIYSSHLLDVVERICTRVILLDRGRIVADGSVDDVRALRASPSLEALFAQLVSAENPADVANRIVHLVGGAAP